MMAKASTGYDEDEGKQLEGIYGRVRGVMVGYLWSFMRRWACFVVGLGVGYLFEGMYCIASLDRSVVWYLFCGSLPALETRRFVVDAFVRIQMGHERLHGGSIQKDPRGVWECSQYQHHLLGYNGLEFEEKFVVARVAWTWVVAPTCDV